MASVHMSCGPGRSACADMETAVQREASARGHTGDAPRGPGYAPARLAGEDGPSHPDGGGGRPAVPPRVAVRRATSPPLSCTAVPEPRQREGLVLTPEPRSPGFQARTPPSCLLGCTWAVVFRPIIFLVKYFSLFFNQLISRHRALNRISNRIKCSENLSPVYSVCDKAPSHRFCDRSARLCRAGPIGSIL